MIRSVLKFSLGVLAVSLALAACHYLGVASAAGVVVGDPIVVATTSTGDGWSLVQQYGPLWGGALLMFGLAGALLKANAASHWLAQGRALALITGALSTLGAVLEWRFNGGAAAGVLVTAVMALKLVLSPTPSSSPGAGAVTSLLAVLLIGALATQPACSTIRGDAATGVGAMIDCEQSGIASTVTELLALAKTAILSTISGDGKHVDAAALKAAASGLKSNAARCAFASAVAILAKPMAPKPGAPAAAALEIDGGELRAAFESVRSELGGAVYRTQAGVL